MPCFPAPVVFSLMTEGKPVVRWRVHLPGEQLHCSCCDNNKYTSLWLLPHVSFFTSWNYLILSFPLTLKKEKKRKKEKKKRQAVGIAKGVLPVQILPWIFIHGRICSAFAFLWALLWINSYSSRSLWISKKLSKSIDFICKNVCEFSLSF